jgi:hypothetical protein
MRESELSKTIFMVMGVFALGCAVVILLGGIFVVARYPLRSWVDLVWPTVDESALVIAGIGLFYRRKWAALMVSLMALYVASWQVKSAITPIPRNANWLGFVFAFVLAIPAILTVIYWRTLVWAGQKCPPG